MSKLNESKKLRWKHLAGIHNDKQYRENVQRLTEAEELDAEVESVINELSEAADHTKDQVGGGHKPKDGTGYIANEENPVHEMYGNKKELDENEDEMGDMPPMDDAEMGGEPELDAEMPPMDDEMGGGAGDLESVVKDLVKAIASALESETGVDVDVEDDLGGADDMGGEMPPMDDEMGGMDDEMPPMQESSHEDDDEDDDKDDLEEGLAMKGSTPEKVDHHHPDHKLSDKGHPVSEADEKLEEMVRLVMKRLTGSKK